MKFSFEVEIAYQEMKLFCDEALCYLGKNKSISKIESYLNIKCYFSQQNTSLYAKKAVYDVKKKKIFFYQVSKIYYKNQDNIIKTDNVVYDFDTRELIFDSFQGSFNE